MKPPAFQFYPDNFLGGTAHMSTEEVGAYALLLCFQWNAGSVPGDDDSIRRIARVTQAFPLGSLKAKFEIGPDGLLRNARLEKERAKQVAYREKQAINGQMGGRPKGLVNPSLSSGLSQTKAKKSFPSPSPSPTSDPNGEGNAPLPSLINEFNDAWDTISDNLKIPKCLVVSDARRRKLEARFRDSFFAANWKAALEKLRSSAFCKGKNDRGWVATFDWFIQPDSVPKIMEGKYDDRKGTHQPHNKRNDGVARSGIDYGEAARRKVERQVAQTANPSPQAQGNGT